MDILGNHFVLPTMLLSNTGESSITSGHRVSGVCLRADYRTGIPGPRVAS